MAETLSMISIIAFAAAGICLMMAVIFFIRFKIPSVIGDLSGRNARRSIEQMRKFNEKSGNKSYKPSKTNAGRGKITETMRKAEKRNHLQDDDHPETGLLAENIIKFPTYSETELLDNHEGTELLQDENETVKLNDNKIETDEGIPIQILDEVMIIHTDEVIQ